MLYVGMDVHKRRLRICVLDGGGSRVLECALANEREAIVGFLARFDESVSVALEATHNWGMIYDLVSGLGCEVHICHAREARLIGMARVKTDRNDAQRLASLLRAGMLPEAYVPSQECRQLRDLVRSRSSLTRMGTRLKNQIHAILTSRWLKHSYSDLFGKAGRGYLRELELGECSKKIVVSKLELLESVEAQTMVLNEEISHRAHLDLRAMLLTTIPGVAEFTAVMILSEIGDILRFHSSGSLVNYAGLHPSEDSSGDRVRRGRITKEGSRWLRWILVESAQHTVRQDGKIRDLYLRVFAKKGHNKAIVAAAREMLVAIYYMLNRMEPYRADGRCRSAVSTSEAR